MRRKFRCTSMNGAATRMDADAEAHQQFAGKLVAETFLRQHVEAHDAVDGAVDEARAEQRGGRARALRRRRRVSRCAWARGRPWCRSRASTRMNASRMACGLNWSATADEHRPIHAARACPGPSTPTAE